MRPIIGITTYSAETMLADVAIGTAMLPSVYVTAVRRAGGCPIMLPAGGDYDEAVEVMTSLDGIVLPGGPDIEPRSYGQPRHFKTQTPDPVRDEWERIIIGQALLHNIPMLGICRGMQAINIALGGTLYQHLRNAIGRHMPDGPGFGNHKVTIAPDSHLAMIMHGTPLADVSTRHHQAVNKLGEGLRAVAWETDGTVEAVESDSPLQFLLGVQWHPERDPDQRVFSALVSSAAEKLAGSAPDTPGQV